MFRKIVVETLDDFIMDSSDLGKISGLEVGFDCLRHAPDKEKDFVEVKQLFMKDVLNRF